MQEYIIKTCEFYDSMQIIRFAEPTLFFPSLTMTYSLERKTNQCLL